MFAVHAVVLLPLRQYPTPSVYWGAPVAGVAGAPTTWNVNFGEAGGLRVIWNVPLYSGCVAPKIVMYWPLVRVAQAAAATVAVAVVPTRVMLVMLTAATPAVMTQSGRYENCMLPESSIE